MKTMLIRRVNERLRYYKIEIIANLFGEHLLICTYGSRKRAKPTGMRVDMYLNAQDAYRAFNDLLTLKVKKGYLSSKGV